VGHSPGLMAKHRYDRIALEQSSQEAWQLLHTRVRGPLFGSFIAISNPAAVLV
jgi:hypothetical protein